MRTFLIQTVDGHIRHDFAFHLAEAIRYNNWIRGEKAYEAILCEKAEQPGCVPVGSLEFVFAYMREHCGLGERHVAPINIPPALFQEKFLKRECRIAPKGELSIDKPTFLKSATRYKSFIDTVETLNGAPEDIYLASEVVDIESEWRAFVCREELVGLQCYLGDFFRYPDASALKEMIRAYADAPPAYTLDVGVSDRGTFVIEVHPFVSCGLYGFADYKRLPMMFASAFNHLLITEKRAAIAEEEKR